MKILDRVKTYCERQGISQQEFSRLVGIHPTNLSRLLNGRIKNISVLKIDAYLDSVENHSSPRQDTTNAPEA